jgi:transposase
MISFNRKTRVFVCKEPTDMRSSYDSLFAKTKGVLNQDPFSGHLFVFMNKTRSSVKCLFYDGTGLVLLCKRLERGTFSRLNPYFTGEITLTAAEFALFFEGASFEKRFIHRDGERDFVESPEEIKKVFPVRQELQGASM